MSNRFTKKELEAAVRCMTSNQKLPSFELPTFHFYDKAKIELTENMDKAPLAGHEFHKKSDKELHEIRQNVETILHYRMHGGKKINESYTNTDERIPIHLRNPKAALHSDKTKNVERTSARDTLRKKLVKKSVERLDDKMERRAKAMKKEDVNEVSDELLYRAQSKAQFLRDKAGRTSVQMYSKHRRKVSLGKAQPFENTPEHRSGVSHEHEKWARHKQAQKFFDYRQKKKQKNEEVNEAKKPEEFFYGDKVHLGFGKKGGAGIRGSVHKFHGNDTVEVKSADKHYDGITKSMIHKFWKGPRSFLTKESADKPLHYRMHEGKKLNEVYGAPTFKGGAWSGYDSKLKQDEKEAKNKKDLHGVMTKAGLKTRHGSTNSFKKDKTTYTFETYDNIERHPTKKGYHSGYSADGSHWLINKVAKGEYAATSTHGKGYIRSHMGLKALSAHLKKVDKHGNSDPISKNYYDKPYDKHESVNEGIIDDNPDWNKSYKEMKKKGFKTAYGTSGVGVGRYSKSAVDKEIKKDRRIKGKEARMIHTLLKGRQKEDE